MLKLARGLLVVLLLPLFAAACSGGDSDTGTPPSSQATTVDLTQDDLGRKVTPPAEAKRVVAMSPTVVELMFAVGATPVGRPASADYPEAAKAVASFGQSRSPNLEEIVAMKPDLIIADALLIDQTGLDALSRTGVPIYAVRVASIADVTRGLRVVGALTGHKQGGEESAVAIEKKLGAIKVRMPAAGPSVLVLVAAGPGQFIAGRSNTYLGDVLAQLGARNVVTSEPENFNYAGFTDYSPERILEKDPDIIITASIGGPPGTPTTLQLVKSSPAFSSLKAVKNGRVYEVDPFVYIQSAGPRVSLILDELPKLLYPDTFTASAR